jgi:hypothetical protein
MRPLLLGNVPIDQWPSDGHGVGEPWASFVAARDAYKAGNRDDAIARWQTIADMQRVESRHTLQAWTFLRVNGVQPPDAIAAHVLGAIVEVPVEGGRDVLAAYRDGSARYLNHAGNVSVFENGPDTVTAGVVAMIDAAQPLADVVGLWDKLQLPELPAGDSRLLLLTPGGFRFGQGPGDQLMKQPLADALFTAATQLLVVIADLQTTAS